MTTQQHHRSFTGHKRLCATIDHDVRDVDRNSNRLPNACLSI